MAQRWLSGYWYLKSGRPVDCLGFVPISSRTESGADTNGAPETTIASLKQAEVTAPGDLGSWPQNLK
jgi:hypothetical protein